MVRYFKQNLFLQGRSKYCLCNGVEICKKLEQNGSLFYDARYNLTLQSEISTSSESVSNIS